MTPPAATPAPSPATRPAASHAASPVTAALLPTIALAAALVGCSSPEGAGRGRVESSLRNPMGELTDTSSRQPQASRIAPIRPSGLTVAIPRADPSAFTSSPAQPPSPAALGTGRDQGTDGAGAPGNEADRISADDLPYAGPAPARLAARRSATTGTDADAAGGPFPKSQYQRRQEALRAESLPPTAPLSATPTPPPLPERVLLSERDDEAVGAAGVRETAPGTSDDSGAARPWGVVLATCTGDDARALAEATAAHYRQQYPQIADIHVRSKPSGSVVLAGHFAAAAEDAAQRMLERVKSIESNGQRAFPKAMLVPMTGVVDGERIPPHDVRQLRLQYPKANPLYTLQVAVWSDLGSGTMTAAEVRRRAEAYCAELRSQGVAAYYFHTDERRGSTVMVGAFGAEAYDPRTTLFSDEVTELLERFPKHLVNGEELLIARDPSQPEKRVPQAPQLVEVPR